MPWPDPLEPSVNLDQDLYIHVKKVASDMIASIHVLNELHGISGDATLRWKPCSPTVAKLALPWGGAWFAQLKAPLLGVPGPNLSVFYKKDEATEQAFERGRTLIIISKRMTATWPQFIQTNRIFGKESRQAKLSLSFTTYGLVALNCSLHLEDGPTPGPVYFIFDRTSMWADQGFFPMKPAISSLFS
jgi:hypothetical protein